MATKYYATSTIQHDDLVFQPGDLVADKSITKEQMADLKDAGVLTTRAPAKESEPEEEEDTPVVASETPKSTDSSVSVGTQSEETKTEK